MLTFVCPKTFACMLTFFLISTSPHYVRLHTPHGSAAPTSPIRKGGVPSVLNKGRRLIVHPGAHNNLESPSMEMGSISLSGGRLPSYKMSAPTWSFLRRRKERVRYLGILVLLGLCIDRNGAQHDAPSSWRPGYRCRWKDSQQIRHCPHMELKCDPRSINPLGDPNGNELRLLGAIHLHLRLGN